MDKQEVMQTLSKIGKISVSYAEDLFDSFFPKTVVPQYVADWYEENKNRKGKMVNGTFVKEEDL